MPTLFEKLFGWKRLEKYDRQYKPLVEALANSPDFKEEGSLPESKSVKRFFQEYRQEKPKFLLSRQYKEMLPEELREVEWLYKAKKIKGGLVKVKVKAKLQSVELGVVYTPAVRRGIVGERKGKAFVLIHAATLKLEEFEKLKRQLKLK